MNAPITSDINLTIKVTEAIWNAISRSKDGYPGVEIGEELAKRGLVIVEIAMLERQKLAIQLIGKAAAALVGEG